VANRSIDVNVVDGNADSVCLTRGLFIEVSYFNEHTELNAPSCAGAFVQYASGYNFIQEQT